MCCPSTMSRLEFELEKLTAREAYFLLTAAVVPRPIAWVSTVGADGTNNLAPYSFFNICSTAPPIVHFTSTGVKDTLTNVRDVGEFVVNIVSHDVREQMRVSSAAFAPGEDEFAHAGLTPADSVAVAAPRVAEAAISFECRLRETIQMGGGYMVFGDVLHAHVSEQVWTGDRIDMVKLQPVGRLSGMNYATIDAMYRLELPAELSKVAEYEVHGDAPALSDDGSARA